MQLYYIFLDASCLILGDLCSSLDLGVGGMQSRQFVTAFIPIEKDKRSVRLFLGYIRLDSYPRIALPISFDLLDIYLTRYHSSSKSQVIQCLRATYYTSSSLDWKTQTPHQAFLLSYGRPKWT
jgi:hypothetical protein